MRNPLAATNQSPLVLLVGQRLDRRCSVRGMAQAGSSKGDSSFEEAITMPCAAGSPVRRRMRGAVLSWQDGLGQRSAAACRAGQRRGDPVQQHPAWDPGRISGTRWQSPSVVCGKPENSARSVARRKARPWRADLFHLYAAAGIGLELSGWRQLPGEPGRNRRWRSAGSGRRQIALRHVADVLSAFGSDCADGQPVRPAAIAP